MSGGSLLRVLERYCADGIEFHAVRRRQPGPRYFIDPVSHQDVELRGGR